MVKADQNTDADPMATAQAHKLMHSERRILGLKAKLKQLREMAAPTEEESVQIRATNASETPNFKINCGPQDSPRDIDTFSEERVSEILEKVKIGPDLTTEQHEKVRDLIRSYADVFALSLSEVRPVNWYQHHLNIDPSIPLPK